nr:unnamed protein product [Haemonchus contortus]
MTVRSCVLRTTAEVAYRWRNSTRPRTSSFRYAKANDWDEMVVDERIKTLMILPDSFRAVRTAFAESPHAELRLYSTLNDIRRLLKSFAARICVLVGPTTDELIPKREWYKLATSLATAARMGMKVIAVAPHRGDKSYARNRADVSEAIESAKSAAVTMKQGLRCLIPNMESPQEPSHGPGAHPKRFSTEAYSREVIQEYYEALRTSVKAEVELPSLQPAPEVAHLELASISSGRDR